MMDDIQNEHLISPKIDNAFEINGADQLVVEQCLSGRFLFWRIYSAGEGGIEVRYSKWPLNQALRLNPKIKPVARHAHTTI
jgi:hypothetical protein